MKNERYHGDRKVKKKRDWKHLGSRFTAILLCLSLLAGLMPTAAAAEERKSFQDAAEIVAITLHKMNGSELGEEVEENALLKKGESLGLKYTYTISEKKSKELVADTPYYLEISPHLVPDLGSSIPLKMKIDKDTEIEFAKLHADGSGAYVTFYKADSTVDTADVAGSEVRAVSDGGITGTADAVNGDTFLAQIIEKEGFGGLEDAYFYLGCKRADTVPPGATAEEKENNRYGLKFENGEMLYFGYYELEPVTQRAKLTKKGEVAEDTITWTLDYTPWQNPSGAEDVTADTTFVVKDRIKDTQKHSYVTGSAKIDGAEITEYSSDDTIPEDKDIYVVLEKQEEVITALTFGGTKLQAGKATNENPAEELKITYDTKVSPTLLLPVKGSSGGGGKIANEVWLALADGGSQSWNIKASTTVIIDKPTWVKKEGTTARTPGSGAVTDWKVTFYPNGFPFTKDNELALHDKLPESSQLVDGSVTVEVDGVDKTTDTLFNSETSGFTISEIETDNKEVVITYQTKIEESVYEDDNDLGENTAWFTFSCDGKDCETSPVKKSVDNGGGSGDTGTNRILKSNTGYKQNTRTIDWTVTINPRQVNLMGGTFIDDLSNVGPDCTRGHTKGLEVVGGVSGIKVLIDGKEKPTEPVTVSYDDQCITVEVGEIGQKTIELKYKTKVCDPCIFANNVSKVEFNNRVITEDMKIGSLENLKASAESKAMVNVSVLKKQLISYDYANGVMKWEVTVDEAGLPMEGVVLEDTLMEGLTYKEDTFKTNPEIADAVAVTEQQADGKQKLTLTMGEVTKETKVTFDTAVDPEALGFGRAEKVKVENTIHMTGAADGVSFSEVSFGVDRSFSNQGLLKTCKPNVKEELIEYEVLINPYRVSLPEKPSLVDTLDSRLQLDADTLKLYEVTLEGTTGSANTAPTYTKKQEIMEKLTPVYNVEANSFTVELPIEAGSTKTYLLTYTADILKCENGSYKTRFALQVAVFPWEAVRRMRPRSAV